MADSRIDDALEKLTAAAQAKQGAVDPGKVVNGVTLSWLCQVFKVSQYDAKKRLRDCPTKPAQDGRVQAVYDVAEAAKYLVAPVHDIDEYMKTIKASDLPPHLQESYWSMMNKKQKWEENAGQLWRTEKVLEVLGDVFQLVKGSIQLWPDAVERSAGLNATQKASLRAQCDGLQKDIHQRLLQMPEDKATAASIDEFEVPETTLPKKVTVHDDLI
jgi:hypothetical protein